MALKRIILGSLIALLLTLAGFAQAVKEKRVVVKMPKEACGKEFAPPGHGMKGCCEDLGLTSEQQVKMIDIKYAHDQETLAVERDLKKKRLELKAEMEKDNPDQAVLDRIFDDAAALRAKLKKSGSRCALAIKAMLTKEQWAKAREMVMAECMESCGDQRGCCGGPGHPCGMGREGNRFFIDPMGGLQFFPGGECGPDIRWNEKDVEKRIKVIRTADGEDGPVTIRVEEEDD